MNYKNLLLIALINAAMTASAVPLEVVPLPYKSQDKIHWPKAERQYYSEIWETEVVTNVSSPSLVVFKADVEIANGTSVIVAPGGALYAHSINSEGYDVARWLNTKGITAFVLKYRLVPTGEDGVREVSEEWEELEEKVSAVLLLSIQDGLEAIDYVRTHSAKLGVDPNKIGFMGFSAGGAVTMGVTYSYTKATRPDFIVPVYAWTTVVSIDDAPEDAPPILVICASDDPLGLAAGSVSIYSEWLAKGKRAGLHMYSKGGHGFGMRKLNLPSDSWIERFYDWSVAEGMTVPKDTVRR
ncbi:MAG: alpha/beta hydrolase [Halioglobus sp.]